MPVSISIAVSSQPYNLRAGVGDHFCFPSFPQSSPILLCLRTYTVQLCPVHLRLRRAISPSPNATFDDAPMVSHVPFAFASPLVLLTASPPSRNAHRSCHCAHAPATLLASARTVTTSHLSLPFPQPDVFAIPLVVFPATAAADVRPELLGALLWSLGLYLGFSQNSRWADSVRIFLTTLFRRVAPTAPAAIFAADVLHTLPFLAAGFGVDAALRAAAAGNAVWAVATGTTIALYAGVYDLARQSAKDSLVSEDDELPYAAFAAFADRSLTPKGMCHFFDVRDALRRDTTTPQKLRSISDNMLRRFVQNRFPRAKRTPNGFYRGLSIRTTARPLTQQRSPTTPSSPPPDQDN